MAKTLSTGHYENLVMKLFKEVFGRIWALWAAVIFIVSMLIFLIPYLLILYRKKDPERTKRFIPWSKVWIDLYLILIGCPLTIKGKENFAPGENYIVLCNHNSFMDVPVSSPSIPGGNKTIAKIEMASIPVFNIIYKSGSVLVDRKSDSSRKESYNKMKAVLQMGLHMCIYPEGTRNLTKDPLKSFHNGAFKLSMDTGKRIIPAIIFNTQKVMPADKIFYCMPHALSIHFLPPVNIEQTDTAETLKQRVHRIMSEYYVRGESQK
jgi:1-acyl-sn-glycerol-3-phosphate acyltransferase